MNKYQNLPILPTLQNYQSSSNVQLQEQQNIQNIQILPDNSSTFTDQTIQVKMDDTSDEFMEPQMKLSILTKQKQNEQKRRQKESIILRTFVFMRMLVNNFKFTFVIQRNRRNSYKGLQYFPIEKVYNEKGEMIYDIDSIDISVNEKKVRYCQVYVIELMRRELERFGYQFKKKQTKKASKIRDGHQPITLTKVKIMIRNKDKTKYSMEEMEQRIGFDGYNTLKELFVGPVTKFIFGNKDTMDIMHQFFVQTHVIDNGTDFIREGNEDLLENVYFGEVKEEIGSPETNQLMEMNQVSEIKEEEMTEIEQYIETKPNQEIEQTDLLYYFDPVSGYLTPSDSTSFISGY